MTYKEIQCDLFELKAIRNRIIKEKVKDVYRTMG